MKTIKVQIVQAFADANNGGNPAGVVLEADQLTSTEKLEVARQVGLSETAFVSSSQVADFRLDFFTPNKQIPHCGHATIATFSHLRRLNKITGPSSSKETIDGNRNIYFEGDVAYMEQSKPIYIPLGTQDRINTLAALHLQESDLLPGLEPIIVNTGNNFLIIPLRDESLLQHLDPDMKLIEEVSAKYNLIAFYPYSPTLEAGVAATTRMFGPYYGIPEEAATGMAAGPLACYLDKYKSINEDEIIITQGRFMSPPSPSRIKVRLEKKEGVIQKLYAGGTAYVAREVAIHLS